MESALNTKEFRLVTLVAVIIIFIIFINTYIRPMLAANSAPQMGSGERMSISPLGSAVLGIQEATMYG